MHPCVNCRYSALCLALGGASEVASHLVEHGTTAKVVSYDVMKYADGTPAPTMINRDAVLFYHTRPKDCPGSQP